MLIFEIIILSTSEKQSFLHLLANLGKNLHNNMNFVSKYKIFHHYWSGERGTGRDREVCERRRAPDTIYTVRRFRDRQAERQKVFFLVAV